MIPHETDPINLITEPSEQDWLAYCAAVRPEREPADPPPLPTLPAADWIDGEAARHDDLSRDEGPIGTHRLVAGELRSLAGHIRFHGSRTAAEFAAAVPRFRGLHRLRVELPHRHAFESALAWAVAEEGVLLATAYTELGALAATVLLELATDVEGYGSATADDYLCDEAAARAAALEAMSEGF